MKTLMAWLMLLLFGLPAWADDTKATLKEPLAIKDVQGGFAGFTGQQWTIQPSGAWKLDTVFNERLTEKAKGELKKEQLAELARELEKYKLDSLPSKGKPMTNPRVVTIKHGKKSVSLTLPAGGSLPKPDAGTVEGRYGGIAAAVKKLTREK